MVEADHIEELSRPVNATQPPAEAVFFHRIPAVEGIPPKLARGAEIVRRHPSHRRGAAPVIQREKLRRSPHITGIRSHIDRQIAYDGDILLPQIRPQGTPLLKKQILQIDIK